MSPPLKVGGPCTCLVEPAGLKSPMIRDYVDASLLWYGGSVLPVSSVNVTGDVLTVTRTQAVNRELEDGSTRRHVLTNTLKLKPDGDRLSGTAYFPNRSTMGTRVIEFEAARIAGTAPCTRSLAGNLRSTH